MRNSRRVVVTGLGVVAPNGIGKETFWRNLIAGKSAVDYITAFDPSPYPSRVAGEIRESRMAKCSRIMVLEQSLVERCRTRFSIRCARSVNGGGRRGYLDGGRRFLRAHKGLRHQGS